MARDADRVPTPAAFGRLGPALALAAGLALAGCAGGSTRSANDYGTCFAPSQGDPDAVIAACGRIVTFARITGNGNRPGLDPRRLEAQGRTARAIAHYRKGEAEKAIADLDAAIRADPTLGAAHSNRGGILLARGDAAGAVRDLREALRLNPDNGFASAKLAQAEARLARGGGGA